MNDQSDFPIPEPDSSSARDIKPWEQRQAPGMGGGGDSAGGSGAQPQLPDRYLRKLQTSDMGEIIDDQTRLAHYPIVDRFTVPQADTSQKVDSNEQAWQLFIQEQLFDTRRVTLEHFHLFEWFPLSPGKFHTEEGRQNRQQAFLDLVDTSQGIKYFNPSGKLSMLRGGIGAVRLRPRLIAGEPHFFMTASSSAVCHEGFPVLIPRSFYAQVKPRLLAEGAVPVNLAGEMRYLMEDLPSFFEGHREIPALYLYVDDLTLLPSPRPEVTEFAISAAVSFVGEFQEEEGLYATYCTFDPAIDESLQHMLTWIEQFYVTQIYKGAVVTDFDEVQPRFPQAVFGLPDLMAGKLDQSRVKAFLASQGLDSHTGQKFFLVYKEINTQGGAYIAGDVITGGGDFVGRDQSLHQGEPPAGPTPEGG
jgi:hypothetical protein